MQGGQFADHLSDEVIELTAGRDAVDERFILAPHFVPIHAVHLGVVEIIVRPNVFIVSIRKIPF